MGLLEKQNKKGDYTWSQRYSLSGFLQEERPSFNIDVIAPFLLTGRSNGQRLIVSADLEIVGNYKAARATGLKASCEVSLTLIYASLHIGSFKLKVMLDSRPSDGISLHASRPPVYRGV